MQKLGIIKRVQEGGRGIGYKLGIIKGKTSSDQELTKISEGYQYPHQYEELKKVYYEKILPPIEAARANVRKPI